MFKLRGMAFAPLILAAGHFNVESPAEHIWALRQFQVNVAVARVAMDDGSLALAELAAQMRAEGRQLEVDTDQEQH